MLPVAQREAQLAPAIPPVEPSPRFAARVASGIFAGQALILLIIGVLPHQGGAYVARLVIAAACAVFAVALHMSAGKIGLRGLQAAAACGTLLLSLQLLLSVDSNSLSDEMLYIWLALYAAYFFPVRQAAALLRAVRDAVTGLVRSLAEVARTDTLTGLKNRLALEQEIHVEVERTLRAENELSIVIGDLDHFKAVNDELGHRAGDEALVRIGQILHKHRRVGDSVARTGGEEFTILLPGASEHEAYLVAERLRAQVERDFADHPVPVTFSFGVATYPEHGRNADAVIEAADQALYAAK